MSKRNKIVPWAAIIMVMLLTIGAPIALGAPITFDFVRGTGTMGSYSTALASLRNELKDKAPNPPCGVPTLPQAPKDPPYTYVDVKLKIKGPKGDEIKIVTLAIRKSDSYVLGYLDQLDGKPRSHIFDKDVPDKEKDKLFPEAKGKDYRLTIYYGSDYPSLELKAKLQSETRRALPLGIEKVAEYAQQIYGKKKIVEKDEARFLIATVQMVAEAARFSYIETKIRDNFDEAEFKSNDETFFDLESKWGTISDAIHKSAEDKNTNTRCKTIGPAIPIKDEKGQNFKEVTDVNELKGYIALLKAKSKKSPPFYVLDFDGDHVDVLLSQYPMFL